MIIRTENFEPIENLTRGSNKKVWVTCDECGIGLLRIYKIVNKRPEDYCTSCQNKITAADPEVRKKKSEAGRRMWENKEYRDKMSNVLSEGCQKAWDDNTERRKKLKERHKTPYKDIIKLLSDKNYTIITTEEDWFNQKGNKINYKCDKGHETSTDLARLKSGKSCIYCAGKKLYIPDLEKEVEEKGYKLISYEKGWMTVECDEGHIFKKRRNSWLQNHLCSYCINNKMYYDDIKKKFENNNLILLTTKEEFEEFPIKKTHLKTKCQNSHITEIPYSRWRQETFNCSECEIDNRWGYLKNLVEKENYELLTTKQEWLDTKNSNSIFWFRCPNGHEHYMQWNNWYGNQRCGECWANTTKSRQELEIKEFLSENGIETISTNTLFPGRRLEIDMYSKEHNICIEFNGNFFHREMAGKGEDYHLYKQNIMENEGYTLIQIFEDEWVNKKDIVKSKLLNLFGKELVKRYARRCEVREIDTKEAKEFINSHHISGYSKSNIKLGLFYNDELVSVMTLSSGNVNVSKGILNQDGDIWELNKFCSSINVVGGAGKLLSYFKKNYKWDKIYTYADRRWSKGNLYYKLGFKLIKITKPTSWYLKNDNLLKRCHRSLFIHTIINEGNKRGLSEWESMQEAGYDRIWDCGHYRFELVNE